MSLIRCKDGILLVDMEAGDRRHIGRIIHSLERENLTVAIGADDVARRLDLRREEVQKLEVMVRESFPALPRRRGSNFKAIKKYLLTKKARQLGKI
jgi:hypothetical protein